MSENNSAPLEAIGGLLLFFAMFMFVLVAIWDFLGDPSEWLFWNIGIMFMLGAFMIQYDRMTK